MDDRIVSLLADIHSVLCDIRDAQEAMCANLVRLMEAVDASVDAEPKAISSGVLQWLHHIRLYGSWDT